MLQPDLGRYVDTMRRPETSPADFRSLMFTVSTGLVSGIVDRLPSDGEVVLLPIVRSGSSMLEAALSILPVAKVGHIGMHRDPNTFLAIEYYCKLPQGIETCHCVILDPVMATGHTAVATMDRLEATPPSAVTFVTVLTTPEALEYLRRYYPQVQVVAASLEDGLDERGHVIPGFGDVGERLFGTP